jgi:AcrR family transcriptional regulator
MERVLVHRRRMQHFCCDATLVRVSIPLTIRSLNETRSSFVSCYGDPQVETLNESSEQRPARVSARKSRAESIERRVLEAALELAAQGGFDAVRQRDVAERAGVALGTLYKRFESKDELLIGVLELESQKLASRIEREPLVGDTPLDRVVAYFSIATHYVVRKPRLGRAVLRAVTSGERVSGRVMAYHARQLGHVVDALVGKSGEVAHRVLLSESDAAVVAPILLQVWFAALVGWSGELFGVESVLEQVQRAATLLLAGLEAERASAARQSP